MPLGDPFASKSGTADQDKADIRDFRRTIRIQLALDIGRNQVVIDGLGDVGTSAQFEVVSILAAQYRSGSWSGARSKNYAFVATDTLMEELGVDSEAALRKRISEFRRCVADLALEKWGIPLSRNAVIENRTREGYRVNPDVVIIATDELR